NKYKVPRLAFVNKMDRTGANFDKVDEQLKSRLGAYPAPMQVPVGAEDGFDGVIDLLKMKRIHWDSASQGPAFEYGEFPGELTEDEIIAGLRERTLKVEIVPVFCGTAFKNKGVQAMLDGVVHLLPSPSDRPPVQGIDDNEKEDTRLADDKAPFSALAFKIMT